MGKVRALCLASALIYPILLRGTGPFLLPLRRRTFAATSPARDTGQEIDFGVGGKGLVPVVAVDLR